MHRFFFFRKSWTKSGSPRFFSPSLRLSTKKGHDLKCSQGFMNILRKWWTSRNMYTLEILGEVWTVIFEGVTLVQRNTGNIITVEWICRNIHQNQRKKARTMSWLSMHSLPCLSWNDLNDFGIRGAGKVYRQCKRCRKSRKERTTKQADESKENQKD